MAKRRVTTACAITLATSAVLGLAPAAAQSSTTATPDPSDPGTTTTATTAALTTTTGTTTTTAPTTTGAPSSTDPPTTTAPSTTTTTAATTTTTTLPDVIDTETSDPAEPERVDETPVDTSLPEDTTTTTSSLPIGAEVAPPIGEGIPPVAEGTSSDAVAAAAQATYRAFLGWQAALAARRGVALRLADLNARQPSSFDPWDGATAADAVTVGGAPAPARRVGAPRDAQVRRAVTAATGSTSAPVDSAQLATAVASLGAEDAQAAAAVTGAAASYRAARNVLIDAIATRSGPGVVDTAKLAGVWETTDPRRLAVMYTALMQVGDPYVFAKAGPTQFDCSGLTLYAWRVAGISLFHGSDMQQVQSLARTIDTLKPGDMAFKIHAHVVMSLGLGRLAVQAANSRTGVVVGNWGMAETGYGSPLADATPAVAPASGWFGAAAVGQTVAPDVPFAAAFNAAGARHGVAPTLLAGLAAVATGFRTDVVGPDGVGLMQLRPAEAAALRIRAADPVASIDGAARRLLELWERLGDADAVVLAYRSAFRTVTDPALIPRDDAANRYLQAVTAAAVGRAAPVVGQR